MPVLWVGHEAECYTIETGANTEIVDASEAGYERTGFRIGRGGGQSHSRPDFAAQNEIWHRFRNKDNFSPGEVIWAIEKADGTKVARITATGFSGPLQYQVSSDGVAFTNVGATFAGAGDGAVGRFDVHHRGTVDGHVEVYYGVPGGQVKVVDVTGDYSASSAIVRIYHGANTVGGGFDTDVAGEVVQTTPTLSTTSEVKPPTAQGADVDGTGTFADVDEISYSDVDFIVLPAIGNHQSFTSAARTLTQVVVSGVTLSCRAWYEAGGPTSIKPYLTIAGVRHYGPAFALDLVALGYQYTFLTNPATGVAFTTAEANAAGLEWGWEAAA